MEDAKGSSDNDLGALGYVGSSNRGDYCLVDVSMVASPGTGEALVADPLAILGPEGEAYCSYSFFVRTKSEWPPPEVLKRKRIHCGVKLHHYPRLIKRLLDANMVTLLEIDGEAIENSIFGVWKQPGVSQRLIWSGDRSNLLFREEAKPVDLPTPDILGSLFLDQGEELFLSGCDLSQFYNRLKAPRDLIPLLGMTRIEAKLVSNTSSSKFVISCLTCILMGTSFAVALRQRVTTKILRDSGLSPTSPFASLLDARLRRSETISVPYIDDVNLLGTSASQLNNERDRAARAFAAANLPTEPIKNVIASQSLYSIAIGLAWWKDGTVAVKSSHARKLSQRIFRHA